MLRHIVTAFLPNNPMAIAFQLRIAPWQTVLRHSQDCISKKHLELIKPQLLDTIIQQIWINLQEPIKEVIICEL